MKLDYCASAVELSSKCLRNGKSRILIASVEELVAKTVSGKSLSQKLKGAEFRETFEDASRGTSAGIEIVSASSNAAAAGLQKGDIIISVNKKRVKNFKDMRTAIKKNPKALLLNIQREARGLFILIQ